MSTLYEITGDYLRLLEMLEGEEYVNQKVFEDTLECIEGEFEDKADNYARIIKELIAESDKYDAEIRRMQRRMETLANRSEMLKQHLFNNMKATGKLKFKTGLFSFGIQKNGGKKPMEITDENGITDEYMKMIPDNAKIREALENGENLPFATLKEAGEHLRIR